ncbi:hypothetical protein KAR91_64035, partial [Candidatus Pacearchaeota archaeon]|nr:hypothetical protein [Candidatus Pacearchaeota archaeon]
MRTAFSYYGGKGMKSHMYPPPRYKIIIEPFAGGSAYSLRWHKHKVILCEKNKTVYSIWKFLQSKDAKSYTTMIPLNLKQGSRIDQLEFFYRFPIGLKWFLRTACNVGMVGTGKTMLKKPNTITKIAAVNWKHNTIDKINYWNNKIKHWEIINDSYENLPNITATWFVDPPYNNSAGQEYFESNINYNNLAKWCKNRKGQIIVCENKGADWLNFDKSFNSAGINGKLINKKK